MSSSQQKCVWCGRYIRWASNKRTGRAVSLDPDPLRVSYAYPRGAVNALSVTCWFLDGHAARAWVDETSELVGYVGHAHTCPNIHEWPERRVR